MSHPDFMVVRFAPGLPKDALPEQYDGLWFDVSRWVKDDTLDPAHGHVRGHRAVLTDRLETREDGAVGQVWEVRP